MKEWISEGKVIIELETTEKMEVEYYLVKEVKMEYIEPVYGIAIEKRKNGSVEVEETGGIATSLEPVKGMIEKLRCCKITPMSLIEVIDDLLE